jgi:hypothetical protein
MSPFSLNGVLNGRVKVRPLGLQPAIAGGRRPPAGLLKNPPLAIASPRAAA